MANIPLKTIKFPGLANTYTIPEVSTDLTASGKAAEAAKVGAELATLGDQLDRNTEDIDKLNESLDAVSEDLSAATSAIKAITITGIDVLSLTNATSGKPKKLSVKITATQAGSGTPSPTNVRTISGKSAVNLSISDGTETDAHEIALGQTVYGGELDLISGVLTITEAMYDLSQISWSYQDSVGSFYKATSAFNPPVLEMASVSAGYYALCDTYEVNGYAAMTGTSVRYAISQRNDAGVKRIYIRTDKTNAVTPTGHAVFKIATPIEVQLTPEEIELYTGYNLITADGNIALEYIPNYTSLFEQQAEIWDAINADNIESYYVEEMADTIEKVQKEWDSPALVFLNTTDMHMYSSNANGVQNHQQMFKNMRWLCKQCKVDFALNLGDLTDGTSTQDVTLERGYEATRGFLSLGVPYYFANGNHDTNYAYSGHPYLFTMAENVKAYYGASRGTKYNVSESGTDFYVDFEWTDTRLIVLNANNVDEALEYSYGTTTAQWFTEALNTDKHVILAVHQSPINTQVYNNINTDFASAIISAVNTFIGNGGDLIMLSGHSHLDVAFVSPWLSVMQDCHRFSQTYGEEVTPESGDSHGISGYVGSIVKNARTQGDYTEDLWSVCIYKPDVSELAMIRFGAGADRYFHFEPISPTTVTSKLSGTLTWSTSDATVATVSGGVITGVGSGRCGILAKDANGNFECWIVIVN